MKSIHLAVVVFSFAACGVEPQAGDSSMPLDDDTPTEEEVLKAELTCGDVGLDLPSEWLHEGYKARVLDCVDHEGQYSPETIPSEHWRRHREYGVFAVSAGDEIGQHEWIYLDGTRTDTEDNDFLRIRSTIPKELSSSLGGVGVSAAETTLSGDVNSILIASDAVDLNPNKHTALVTIMVCPSAKDIEETDMVLLQNDHLRFQQLMFQYPSPIIGAQVRAAADRIRALQVEIDNHDQVWAERGCQ